MCLARLYRQELYKGKWSNKGRAVFLCQRLIAEWPDDALPYDLLASIYAASLDYCDGCKDVTRPTTAERDELKAELALEERALSLTHPDDIFRPNEAEIVRIINQDLRR
jgi:hypothetical protein